MHAELLIIGGGPAGLAAAEGYRDEGGAGRVVLLSDDSDAPYHRPPLSKDFLRGESGRAALPLRTDDWYAEREVEVRLGTRAAAVDPAGHHVATAQGEQMGYGRLVLATGSRPLPLPVPGGDHPDVALLRRIGDSERLAARAAAGRSAVVIGSGFIGCEAAASLALLGLDVTLVTTEELPQAARLGQEVGRRIAGWLRAGGVRLVTGSPVAAIEDGRTVVPEEGEPVSADLVVVGAGIAPHVELAEAAGLETRDGRVVTDERMASSAPGVFAAGDIAYARNATAGRHLRVEHWGEAENMGEIAGRNAAGGDTTWAVAPGFWSEIGPHTLKYAAWGDGYDVARLVPRDGGFTAYYGRDGEVVGVLTHQADDDYEAGTALVEAHAAFADLGLGLG